MKRYRFDERVRRGVSRLRGLDIADELEVEIVSELIEYRLTAGEIVHRVYGVGRYEEGFNSCYTRTRRALKRLESKGLVSTSFIGKEKPYRLTDLAAVNLARIGGGREQRGVMSRSDLVFYLATLFLGVPILWIGAGWWQPENLLIAGMYACFFYLLGVSTSRVTRTVRRVV
jgi:hypothetical protein